MKKFLATAAVAAIAATPALAKVTIQDLDMTGDSFATYEEVRNAIPAMSMIDFKEIDANGDRRLSAEEVNQMKAQNVLDAVSDARCQRPSAGPARCRW